MWGAAQGLAICLFTGAVSFGAVMPSASAESTRCLGRDATVTGGPGDDQLVSSQPGDVVAGRGGDDIIIALHDRVTVCGNAGDDSLRGVVTETGYTRMSGGAGNDIFESGAAYFIHASKPVIVDMTVGVVSGQGTDILRRVTRVYGTRHSDAFVSGLRDASAFTYLFGRGGDDEMTGGPGQDILDGGAGADAISGAGGNDLIAGGGGDDVIEGGSGTDAVSYEGAARAVVISLPRERSIGQGRDVITGFETVYGSAHGDVLHGDRQANSIWGRAGADWIYGAGGWDALSGERGRDRIFGNGGADVLRGSLGRDVLRGAGGVDAAYGGSERDLCRAEQKKACP